MNEEEKIVMQFGGKYPCWDKDQIEVECPDRFNTVSLKDSLLSDYLLWVIKNLTQPFLS